MEDNVTFTASAGDGGEPTPWLSAREVAVRLGVAPRQLYKLIDQGALSAYRIDEDLKLRSGDVAAYRGGQPSD